MKDFRIDDHVVVVKDNCTHNAKKGMVGVVKCKKVDGLGIRYAVEFDKSNLWFHSCGGITKDCRGQWMEPDCIELCGSGKKIDDWKIVILPDVDDTTNARLYENGKLSKSVLVKKCYKDAYDKSVAAEEVIKKLFDKQESPEPEKPVFKVGDTVEVIKDYMECPAGMRGIYVKDVGDGLALIDFKIEYPFTHDGFGHRLKNKTGYYINEERLKKV